MFRGVTLREIWQKLVENFFRRQDSALPSWGVKLKRKYWEYRDIQLGRDHLGMDRYGNEYYQYYSHYGGLPTKRVVMYKLFEVNNYHNDPHFFSWLHGGADKPPTPEELQFLYLVDDQRKRKAIAWDVEQELLLKNAKAREKELTERAKAETIGTTQEGQDNLLNEEKAYKYIEAKPTPIITASENNLVEEHEVDLKVLKEIIRSEERKIENYKKAKVNEIQYLENVVEEFDRHNAFKEKFKDVFLEFELGRAKESYSLIEKDPDIVYSLKNL